MSDEKEIPRNGDDYISGFERGLWMLHQHILFKWGVYTTFKWERRHVPLMKNQLIEWFIPKDVTFAYEIAEFVKQELANEVYPSDQDGKFGPWPGAEVKIQVLFFDGIMGYVTQEESKKIAEECLKQFRMRIASLKKEKCPICGGTEHLPPLPGTLGKRCAKCSS